MRALPRLAPLTLWLLAACARDASLPPPPPPPGPGSIQGRVVFAVAGQTQRMPAPGAQVSILGTNLSAIAGEDGRFYLGGVTQSEGVLLVQASIDGSGTPNRQALLQLADLQAGLGRDISLGDVSVVENATVSGRVRLADVPTAGGHSGTLVFVPQGPFLTQTADDGSYALAELPAGAITLSFFHDRYGSEVIDGMALVAGQVVTVRDVLLEPAGAGPPSPGTIAGRVTAPGGNASAAAVTALSATGVSAGPVSPDATGRFSVETVAGVYSVSVELAGFATAQLGNVLVAPGSTVELAIALTAEASLCTPGVACASGCTVGQVTCAGGPGGPVTCTPTGFVVNGTPCGPGLTCQSGACLPACNPGVACQSSSPCRVAKVSCATGVAVCEETAPAELLPVGTTCGPFQVCDAAGACVACAAGTACSIAPPGNPCHAGAYACQSGAPVCVDTGATLAAGTSCGAGQVCSASGACIACPQGAACTPANPCHAGALSCSTGAPVCADAGTNALDGSVCGTDQVCRTGTCGPCAVGSACDGLAGHASPPASPDPCWTYATACSSGLPTCATATIQPDGTPCGSGLVCRSGACAAPGNALRLLTAGPAMHALPNQPLTVTLQLVDLAGNPVLAPDTVTLSAPPGAQVPGPASTSPVDGTVGFTVTLGRATGPQTFRASAPTLFAPLDLVATADVPADGTLIPIANAKHEYAYTTAPGPAAGMPASYVYGVAVASDGTVYFSDTWSCVVKRVDPGGRLAVVAGDGTCTFNGLGGPATALGLAYPYGLALDEPRGVLYIADSGNNRVRALDLASGTLSTVAGDGDPGVDAPYGDGGPALSAQIQAPGHVAIGPESPPALYLSDTGHQRIRRVDPATHVITTLVGPSATCTTTAPLRLMSLTGSTGGSMAFDEGGKLFLSGTFCGGPTGAYYVPGVARRELDGSLALVAGASAGAALDGVPATAVAFGAEPSLVLDYAVDGGGRRRGNLFVSAPSAHYVARVDGATGTFRIVLGTGAPGSTGDFGPATAGTIDYPQQLAIRPGTRDLYVAESYGYAVRMVAGAGSAVASTATLAAISGPASTYPSRLLPGPLNVALTTGSGAPVPGHPVAFALDAAKLPGGWIGSATGITALDGVAGVAARPGLALGRYGVIASFRDLHGDHVSGSPLGFDVDAVAPPAGTVFAAVNGAHQPGSSGVPGPGAVARINQPRGIALATDGTVYFSDLNYFIYRMAPSGLVTRIGGTGSYWEVADGGPALGSGMDAFGLALDEARGQLYFADEYNDRIRRIDLASGFVESVAGGGATNADGPALATSLNAPSRLRLAGGRLYLSDRTSAAERLRRIDLANLASPTIETFLPRGSTRALPAAPTTVSTCIGADTAGTPGLVFWGCGSDPGCAVAEAPDGRLYVSGSFCGPGTVNPPTTGAISAVFGVARVEPDGSLTYVAGLRPNGLFDGQAASSCGFDQPPALATDLAGNLWIAKRGNTATEQKVGYFEATAGVVGPTSVFHLVGSGPAGVDDYVSAAETSFTSPIDLAVGEHVFVTDGYGPSGIVVDALRVVW